MPIEASAGAAGRGHSAPFVAFAFLSLALLFAVVVIRLHFTLLPVLFLALGFASYSWSGRRALGLFLFLLPLISATPGLLFNGYPFNTMGIPLFYLGGMLGAALAKGERPGAAFPGRRAYLVFLALLGLSVLFVFLRWSNLGVSALAFLRDTPVAPSMDRVSFACIFPVVTLALFSLAPGMALLIRQQRLTEAEIFVPLKAGFSLSLGIALVQKWITPGFMAQSWWGREMKQLNGGFSDFNAFGFFAGVLFLYQAQKLIERQERHADRPGVARAAASGLGFPGTATGLDLPFLAVALAAIFASGCRTAFLFVLAALLRFLLAKGTKRWAKAACVLLLAAALLVAGGTLTRRLRGSLARVARATSFSGLLQAVDQVSNGRLAKLRDGARMTGRFPVSGVGAGNFLFYLKYLHHGEPFYEDLPLNHYLLVASETGVPGLLLFVLFLAGLLKEQRPGTVRLVLAAMTGALLFNNFFWFPEALLLFWLFVALGESPDNPRRGRWPALGLALLLAFAVLNVAALRPLHPRTWARETSTPYDYGFSYPEQEGGRVFRWSGEKAGLYVYLHKKNPQAGYTLFCGAPLSHLPGQQQSVDIYWRGQLYRQVTFRENSEYFLRLEDHGEGFLEFRVRPAFNLKKLGLGEESRTLGVQVSGPDR